MIALEVGLVWAGGALYLVASVLGVVALLWRRERPGALLPPLLAAGLLLHGTAVVLRWVRIGHGPYINAYEVLSASAWTGVAFLLWLVLRRPSLRGAAGPAAGVCVILLGWGVLSSAEVQPLPPSFKNVWLVVHILFAKLAFGAILVGSALALVRILRARRGGEPGMLADLDASIHRFVAFGFVFVGFMIVAGAIWARDAWGAYWSWDPLETWSLVTWVAYGLFLHLRFTKRVPPNATAAFVIGLLALSLATFFVLALVTPTVHTQFMVR